MAHSLTTTSTNTTNTPQLGPAQKLYQAGFRDLIPVIPPEVEISPQSRVSDTQKGKVPGRRISDGWCGFAGWPEHVATPEEVREWDGWGANIGLKADSFPGLDVDVDDEALSEEIATFALETLGDAPTRLSREPRRLLCFRTNDPFPRMALKVESGGKWHLVEFLCQKRQYLIHGRHPSGAEYRWEGRSLWDWAPDEFPLISHDDAVAFLEALAERLKKKGLKAEVVGNARGTGDAPPQDELKAPAIEALRRVARMIPNSAEKGWDEMVGMGYAIKAAGQDHPDEAKDIFLEWTSTWEGGHDLEIDLANWDSFNGPFRIGWSWLQERAASEGDYLPAQDVFDPVPGANPPDRVIADPRSAALEALNRTYAVAQVGSDVVILQEQEEEGPVFLKPASFRLKFQNRTVPSATDMTKRDPLANAWLKWEGRREYDRVVFRPGNEGLRPGEYNLWQGWAVHPDPNGQCDLFLAHIREVVCGENEEHFEWLMDWLAHLVQHPAVKPGIAVALKGGQGAGKSLVGAVLKELLGPHQVIADKADQVTGRFNGHLAHCLLLQAEEAFWGGDKQSAGALKHLVTGEFSRIERKGIDSVEMPSYTRLLITTNEDWVWPTSIEDRRLAIFEVSNDYVGEDLYFEMIFMELQDLGGYGKLLHLLLSRKLPSARLDRPPTTAALRAQAAESMPPEEIWLLNLLSSGEIEGQVGVDGTAIVNLRSLYDSYCSSTPRGYFTKNEITFAGFLQDKLGAQKTGKRPRTSNRFGEHVRTTEYHLPPLDTARANYSQRGRGANQEWDEPSHWTAVAPNGLPPVEPGALENPATEGEG